MKLHELRDNPGQRKRPSASAVARARAPARWVAAGIQKGQKSRSGVAISAYEGGQMPLYQRLPKRGFNKPNRKEFAVVNLGLIQKFVEAGKLDAKAEITEDALVASGLVRRKLDGIRVLAKGRCVGQAEHLGHRGVEIGGRGGGKGRRHAENRSSSRGGVIRTGGLRPPVACGRS